MKILRIILLLSNLLVVACVTIVFVSQKMSAGHREFKQLLSGDANVDVKSIVVVGHGQEIVLHDPAAIKYITNAIRGRGAFDNNINGHGYSWSAIFIFSSGASITVGCNAPDNEDGIIVDFPYGGDPPTEFWAPFRRPIPPAVSELLVKMGWRSAKGRAAK